MTKAILCLMGPTACGKTDLALRLSKKAPIEIVSVDSALVYRGMDIGTAKPTKEEQRNVPHHLIDLIDPDEAYSVARFCQDARKAIADIQARNCTPLLVGGTMLYFKALQQGLAPLPAADASVRQTLSLEAEKKGWDALYKQLQAIDPITAKRLKPTDKQRIQRALEVYELTHTPLSSLLKNTHRDENIDFHTIRIVPQNRAWLHARIAARFQEMLKKGFVEEVQTLLERWPCANDTPSFKMVGYRQALDYLQHQNIDEFAEKATAATRQLAKRQITWLRHWPNGTVVEPEMANVEEFLTQYIR